MELIKNLKKTFVAEKIKINKKQLLLICLVSPMLTLIMVFLATESYVDINNMLQGYTEINDFVILQIGIYLELAQPLFLVLVCYIIFNQIENQKDNIVLQNSTMPYFNIIYSKTLIIFKYNFYNLLYLVGYILIFVILILVYSEKELIINYKTLINTLSIIIILPIFSLLIISFINILSKWFTNFYVSFLVVLPMLYLVNYNIIMNENTMIYSFFNIQFAFLNKIGFIFPISNFELNILLILNLLITILLLFLIKYFNQRSFK